MDIPTTRPASLIILMILIAFQGVSGLAGGIGLLADPSGNLIQLPLHWLEGSPFTNYFIPGLILLVILGIFPVITFVGLLRRWKYAWYASLFIGIALIIWIMVEIAVIGYHPQPPLQMIYGTLGVLILIVVLLPTVKRAAAD